MECFGGRVAHPLVHGTVAVVLLPLQAASNVVRVRKVEIAVLEVRFEQTEQNAVDWMLQELGEAGRPIHREHFEISGPVNLIAVDRTRKLAITDSDEERSCE